MQLVPGQVVRATVTHVEAYGFYLVHEGVQIFAHAVDLPWGIDVSFRDAARMGDEIDVTILRILEDGMPICSFPLPVRGAS